MAYLSWGRGNSFQIRQVLMVDPCHVRGVPFEYCIGRDLEWVDHCHGWWRLDMIWGCMRVGRAREMLAGTRISLQCSLQWQVEVG
jgi:hypothetical protein